MVHLMRAKNKVREGAIDRKGLMNHVRAWQIEFLPANAILVSVRLHQGGYSTQTDWSHVDLEQLWKHCPESRRIEMKETHFTRKSSGMPDFPPSRCPDDLLALVAEA